MRYQILYRKGALFATEMRCFGSSGVKSIATGIKVFQPLANTV